MADRLISLRIRFLFLLSVGAVFTGSVMGDAPSAMAYRCDNTDQNQRNATVSSSDRFDPDADGTLVDIESGLTWMRCSLGQQWNGNRCIGEPQQYTWTSATKASQSFNNAGGYARHTDWRMPSVSELASIVDLNCRYPRIDLTLFPDTPVAIYWTTDAKRGTTNMIYALDFGVKGIAAIDAQDLNHVRLVRGRD